MADTCMWVGGWEFSRYIQAATQYFPDEGQKQAAEMLTILSSCLIVYEFVNTPKNVSGSIPAPQSYLNSPIDLPKFG